MWHYIPLDDLSGESLQHKSSAALTPMAEDTVSQDLLSGIAGASSVNCGAKLTTGLEI